jgi:Uma2 family endonuclease
MTTVLKTPRTIRPQKQFVLVAEFERWVNKKRTDQRYEFVNGIISKKEPMKQNEFFIVKFLVRLFAKTRAYKNGAELLPEADTYIDEYRKRIPDLAYFTAQQIKQAAQGVKVVPLFVIELLSDSETFTDVELKVRDYFDAGVQTVWYINPRTQTIHSYTSAKTVQIYSDEDTCTAQPALPDFSLVVSHLFTID